MFAGEPPTSPTGVAPMQLKKISPMQLRPLIPGARKDQPLPLGSYGEVLPPKSCIKQGVAPKPVEKLNSPA